MQKEINEKLLEYTKNVLQQISQSMIPPIDKILEKILYIGIIGSHVYKTATPESDYDLYVIINNKECIMDKRYQVREGSFSYYDGDKAIIMISDNKIDDQNVDISIYSYDDIVKLINEGHPTIFELKFLPDDFVIYNTPIMSNYFTSVDILDPNIRKSIRHGFSRLARLNEVKARKKFNDGEIYIAIKTQYHHLRILLFALQIYKYGKIIDWNAGSDYLTLLKNDYENKKIISVDYFKESTAKWIKSDTSKTYNSGKTVITYFKECFPL